MASNRMIFKCIAASDLSRKSVLLSVSRLIFVFTILAFTVLACAPDASSQDDPSAESPRRVTTDQEVQELIEELGSDSYATRIRARTRLQRLGLEAFDALREAQMHSDSEILSAARYLISSLHVGWSKETDPLEVREALSEYGAHDVSERESRIRLLADLPNRRGLEALVRLARFESNSDLSQLAALLALQQPISEQPSRRIARARRMREVLQKNDRHASQWLLAYADDLEEGGYSADRWSRLIKEQREQLDNGLTQTIKPESVLELVRVCAARAVADGLKDEAIRLAIDHADLVPARTRGLVDACQWAINHELFAIVTKLREQHRHMFDAHAMLMYSAAQAALADGDDQGAQELAGQARQIRPFPATEEEKETLSDKELQEIGYAHQNVADHLADRGLFEWAESEYRLIIDAISLESKIKTGITARRDLALLAAQLERHDDVIQWLQPIADRAEKDRAFNSLLGHLQTNLDGIVSMIDHHRGLKAMEEGENESAKKHLMSAYQRMPRNINILISMYKLVDESDEDWTKDVNRLRTQMIGELESEINSAVAMVRRGIRSAAKESLADARNEYAWLVSNTQGDFQRAIRESQQSLAAMPNHHEYMDTLARCYFAAGDYQLAVQTQQQALALKPHSPEYRRALREFQSALSESDQEEESSSSD